jgi:hypothetical protein
VWLFLSCQIYQISPIVIKVWSILNIINPPGILIPNAIPLLVTKVRLKKSGIIGMD